MDQKPKWFKVSAGSEVIFRGCSWDAQWEFDHPTVLYEPIERYSPNGTSIESLIENICIVLCNGHSIPQKFDAADLQEFKWRGWSPKGFRHRRSANHESRRVHFFGKDHRLSFRIEP